MKFAEIVTALGGGALVGWISRAFISRERRLATEAAAAGKRAQAAALAQSEEIHADAQTAHLALDMAREERARYERQVMGHMECLARVERLQSRLDAIEIEHASCPGRVERLERALGQLAEALARAGVLPADQEGDG